jgi:hypothetical protein
MKKLILFILLIPLFGLAQNRPLVDAETFMGRDTSYFVDTLTDQTIYGNKTKKEFLRLIKMNMH